MRMVTCAGSLAGMSIVTWEGVGCRGVMGGLAACLPSTGVTGVHRNSNSVCASSSRAACLHLSRLVLRINLDTASKHASQK